MRGALGLPCPSRGCMAQIESIQHTTPSYQSILTFDYLINNFQNVFVTFLSNNEHIYLIYFFLHFLLLIDQVIIIDTYYLLWYKTKQYFFL